jgi:hypothetical protein
VVHLATNAAFAGDLTEGVEAASVRRALPPEAERRLRDRRLATSTLTSKSSTSSKTSSAPDYCLASTTYTPSTTKGGGKKVAPLIGGKCGDLRECSYNHTFAPPEVEVGGGSSPDRR